MTAPTRSLPSLSAVLALSALVLLGCSSTPAAVPPTTAAPTTAAPISAATLPSSDPASTAALASSDPASSGPAPSDPASSDAAPSDPTPESTATESGVGASSGTGVPSDTAGSGPAVGSARIEVSGAICDFLESKIPVTEMATLSGLAVDRTIEMGDTWCIYTSGGPDDIVTVQYTQDAKSSFDLLGADGTPVDTTTLGVPLYSAQDLNGVYFLDGTTQWEVRVGNADNGGDPAQYAAAVTIAQKLLG